MLAETSMCKGPEAGACLACLRNSKETNLPREGWVSWAGGRGLPAGNDVKGLWQGEAEVLWWLWTEEIMIWHLLLEHLWWTDLPSVKIFLASNISTRTGDSVLLWEMTTGVFLFKHDQMRWWRQILVICSFIRISDWAPSKCQELPWAWGFKSEQDRQGSCSQGALFREEIQTVNQQTNTRFQLMRRARKKIKQREMQL